MDFVSAALTNPINRQILQRLPLLGASQTFLVAGCLFQSYWNISSGRPVHADIKDYDIFYFDKDLSWEAEDQVIQRAAALYGDLDAVVEVKNQARVHLWYPERFGAAYPQLTRPEQGIDRFLVRGTCVGLTSQPDGSLRLYAPYGLEDIEAGILRPNPMAVSLHRFKEKASSYKERWPWLRIIE